MEFDSSEAGKCYRQSSSKNVKEARMRDRYGRRRRVTLRVPLNAALSSGLRMSDRASRSSRAFLEYKNINRYEKDDLHGKSCTH
jgi:hypothetical protein